MHSAPARVWLAFALLGAAAARAQVDTVAAPAAALDLRSRDPSLLRSVCELLHAPRSDPAGGGAAATWRLVVQPAADAGRRAVQVSASPEPLRDGAYAELQIDPAAALAAFAPELGVLRMGLEARLEAVLCAAGQPRGTGQRLGAWLWSLLEQPAALRLRLDGDPDRRNGTPLVAELLLEPKPGSALSRWTAALAPNPAGVFAGGARAASLDLRVSLDPGRLADLLAPCAGLWRLGDSGSDAAAIAREIERFAAVWDGTLAFSVDAGRARLLVGSRSAADFAALLADPEVLARRARNASRAGREVVYAPAAAAHRSVDLLRIDARGRGGAAGVTTWCAAAADCTFALVGDDVAAAQALVDRALDGKLERRPLPDGAVLRLDLDLESMRAGAKLSAPAAREQDGGIPRSVRLTVGKTGNSVTARLELR